MNQIGDRMDAALREVSEEVVLPRFENLREGEVEEKSPGEWVSIVDREVEASLTPRLRDWLPGSRVIGEEAVAADGSLLTGLDEGWVWLVDPLDGTANFIAGNDDFAIMVALLREGEPEACWIFTPRTGKLAHAETGGGAYIEGEPFRIPTPAGADSPPGVVKPRFLPPGFKAELERCADGSWPYALGSGSAGIDYPMLIGGHWFFLLYWRTLPWDHVPGVLLVTEAGGHAARLDGSRYRASDCRNGLLVAPDHEAWTAARSALPE